MGGVINCIKCGKPLQIVFFGIGHEFKGGLSMVFEDASKNHWLVCTNPCCQDGKMNVNSGATELDL
jgi:hypothetical protein